MANRKPNPRVEKVLKWVEAHAGFYVFGALLMVAAFLVLGMIIDRTSDPTSNDYLGKWTDYSHEIASAFLGAILTIAVTAFLLKMQERSTADLQRHQIVAQARAEKEKENSAKFFEEKIKIYGILLAGLEEFLQCEKLENKDFTKLTLTCLHVSYIADYDVMCMLEQFTTELLRIIEEDSEDPEVWDERRDGRDPISHSERKLILHKFSEVAISIKTDLDRGRVSIKEKMEAESITQEEYDLEKSGKEKKRLAKTKSIIDNLADCDIAYVEAERRLQERKARISVRNAGK